MNVAGIIALAIAATLAAPAARAQSCQWSGRAVATRVQIAAGRARPFTLDFEGLAVRASADATAGHVVLRTDGALDFTGTVPATRLAIAVAREFTLGGVATIRAGTPLALRSLAPFRIDVTVTPGATLRAVTPVCDAVRLGETADAPATRAGTATRGTLRARVRVLRVHATPGGAEAIDVRLDAGQRLQLAMIESRGGWVRVQRDFFAGSTVAGWVRETDVEHVPDAEFLERGGVGFGGLGMCGSGSSHTYRGPAMLRAGGQILESRGGVPWARARHDVEIESVSIPWGGAWAEVRDIEGVRGLDTCAGVSGRAWIRADALVLPTPSGRAP